MSSRTGLVADELFLARSEFGNIFAELLPGNFCKLQTLDGKEITQGLEVKVRLGTVWKSSLTELSGGQRSLIALSLIMSLLRFKPCVRIFFYFLQELVLMTLSLCSAPMYILDEIDAALDLSHSALPLSLALLRLSLTSTDSPCSREHRSIVPYALQGQPVHRRLAQGRSLLERQRCVPLLLLYSLHTH